MELTGLFSRLSMGNNNTNIFVGAIGTETNGDNSLEERFFSPISNTNTNGDNNLEEPVVYPELPKAVKLTPSASSSSSSNVSNSINNSSHSSNNVSAPKRKSNKPKYNCNNRSNEYDLAVYERAETLEIIAAKDVAFVRGVYYKRKLTKKQADWIADIIRKISNDKRI